MGCIARIILTVAGVIAAWFVAKDAPNFSLIQMVIGLLLVVLVVFAFAFSSYVWTRHRPKNKR